MVTQRDTMRVDYREAMRGGKGTVQLTALSDALPEGMRLFSRIELPPGASIGYHIHEHETELFAFVSGAGRVNDDGELFEISAGDSMLTPSGHGHAVENTGDEPLVLIAAIIKDRV